MKKIISLLATCCLFLFQLSAQVPGNAVLDAGNQVYNPPPPTMRRLPYRHRE